MKKTKRIFRAVSVLLLLALLLSVLPLGGMVWMATAETEATTQVQELEQAAPTTTTAETSPAPEAQTETEPKLNEEDPREAEAATEDPDAESAPIPDVRETEKAEPETDAPEDPVEDRNDPGADEKTPPDSPVEGLNPVPGETDLYQDEEGRWYYVFTREGTKGTVYIYKGFYSGIYFSNSYNSKHGSVPWMATQYLQSGSSGEYTTGQWVYCIDFAGSTASGTTDTYTDLNTAPTWANLSAAKKLGITLALSYGAQSGSHNNHYANVATQFIVWEYQYGGRTSASTYSTNASSTISYASDGNGNYTDYSQKTKIDQEYSRILSSIKKAELVPSFSEQSYTLGGVGAAYAHDFTDTADALSQGVWAVSSCPEELNAQIVNGKLRIYANTGYSGSKTVTLKRSLYRPGSQVYVCQAGSQWAICGVPEDTSEVKVTISVRQTGTVKLKKTTAGSESVLACIQDNPLYSLQGAVYEIHQGSATGPVVEMLTTDANGEASGTQMYEYGTTLYAVETVAPSGYLLNSSPVELTVSTGSNIFAVTDTPTFDPKVLKIKKTGSTSGYIAGAVFKAEFYAANWANPDKLLRTWYLMSDANGFVQFDDNHLAAGFISDPLFKPYAAPQFPLGCVVITEIKTADGYLLPTGNNGKVYIYIRQNEAGQSVTAYWGDASGNPISSGNPKGIYKMENDADPASLNAVNTEACGHAFTLSKVDASGAPLGGAVFRVEYFNAGWFNSDKLERTWYFTSDSTGSITMDTAHIAQGYESDALFSPDAIPVGIMRVKEIAAPEHYQAASFTGVWRMRQVESGSANVDCFWAASDGITPATGYGDEASVDATDPSILTVFNQRLPYATMTKLVSEGSPEGFRFRLRNETASKTYYGESDAAGNVFLTDKHYVPQLADGDKIYEFTDLTPGAIRFVEVNKQGYVPAYFKFSLVNPSGEATQLAYFDTVAILTATESYGGSDYYSPTFQIQSLPAGSILRIEIKNTLKPGTAQMEKLSDTEDVEGFCFKLYHHKDAQHGSKSWYGISDENGAVYVTDQSLTEHGEQERAYTFDGLYDGRYSFIELLSASGRTDVWPEKIELITSGGTTPACHVVFPDPENGYELVADGGDCRISGCELTGLNGGGTLTVKITNKTETPPEPTYGSLTIVKVDRRTREPLEGAGFRLFDAEGNQIAEDYTDQDGCVEFFGLEIGEYTYQEFEAPEGFALDDTLYPFSVTEENLDIELELENDITEGAIRVRKVNEQGQPMKDVFFLLEYSLDDGESWQPIGYRDDNEPVQIGCSTNDDAVDGVAPTSAPDGWIAFEGLAVNTQLGSIQYRLTEVKTWDGYELLAEPAFESCLTAEQTEIELVAVNHPSFEMPMTGSDGFAGAGIGLGLCLLASVLLLLFLPKKREDMNNG